MSIYLTPYDQLHENPETRLSFETIPFAFNGHRELLFYQNAKAAIHHIIRSLELKREDEVFITTTTDSSFVSSCVTCTLFNYARVSRVLTSQTKLIWIIHEFGFPHLKTKEYLKFGIEQNIPIVEDSAHSMDSYLDGVQLGSMADFGIYSLPKSLPVNRGGILRVNESARFNLNMDIYEPDSLSESLFDQYKDLIYSYSNARRNNYKKYTNAFSELTQVFQLSESINPFVFGFITEKYANIYNEVDRRSQGFELGRTHVRDWVMLPVNQFISNEQLLELAQRVKQILVP